MREVAVARSYDMTNRSLASAQTRDRIVSTTERLIGQRPIGDVTLQAIAEGAGVSVQTVLRHFGSRDGCLAALAERVRGRVAEQRGELPTGDVPTAITALVAHYEAEGPLILRLLGQETGDAWAAAFVGYGRDYHRDWVRRFLSCDPGDDGTTIDALVAATDLSVWRLLRLDLGRTPAQVGAAMLLLVNGVREQS